MIEIQNLSFSFGEKTIFENYNLTLPDEGVVVFSAPSGRGKTTLFRLLAGLLKPREGRISGLENRRIGFVFQEDRLLPWLTVKDNIACVSDEKTALSLLEELELSQSAEALPAALSGGMARRVAILRALAFSDDVLFLDEPFTGLDPELKEKTARLIQKKSRLVLMITHDAGEAELFSGAIRVEL